jgi:hypothetical protein
MTAPLAAALVCLLAGAALTSPAFAQSRDMKAWGGPPNMGYDYKTGQSYGVSDFGAAQPAKPKKRRVVRARGNRKNPPTVAETQLKNPPMPEPNPARLAAGRLGPQTAHTKAAITTATDAAPVETGTLAPLDTGPIPCRKYDPTTGRTIEVRCR